MNWKRSLSEWKSVIAGIVFGGAALLLYYRAWHLGYDANAMGLLGSNLIRLIVLLLAWAALAIDFKAEASKVPTAHPRAISAAGVVGGFLIFPGCVGCYPIWPAILLLLLALLFVGRIRPRFSENGASEATDQQLARRDVARIGIGILLFTLTWYLCASTTRQALRGLGERIGDKVGEEKLIDWAKTVIAAHQGNDKSPRLEPDEIPKFIDDLMGPGQGIKMVGLGGWGAEPCVTIHTGTSAYSFRIDICPSRKSKEPPMWLFGDDGSEWRPGIFVGTEGK
jgi:hypothetical protein